jgi:hypothetical protein
MTKKGLTDEDYRIAAMIFRAARARREAEQANGPATGTAGPPTQKDPRRHELNGREGPS